MCDNLAYEDMVVGARRVEDLGCDFVIRHVGYDERRGLAAVGYRMPSPFVRLLEVVAAVETPVQAAGGLSMDETIRTPSYGASLVVVGAPLAVDSNSFKTAGGDIETLLRTICERVHSYKDIPWRKGAL